MPRQTRIPVQRLVFDDGVYYNWENFRDECLSVARESDPSCESVSDDAVRGYAYGEHIAGMNRDFSWIKEAIGDIPMIGIGGDENGSRFFIAKNIFFVRSQVLGDNPDNAFRCWDENGRCLCESYDFQARRRGDDRPVELFEVRQLNKRGLNFLASLRENASIPVEKLFSNRYSNPPRIAELAFGCPAEEWEQVKPISQAKSAVDYLQERGIAMSGSTNVKIQR